MRFLMTGSRAPVALDLSRRLHRAGHVVFHADSLRQGMGKWSNSAAQSFRVPRPVDSPRRYVESLAAIVQQQTIDWLIPTCEEVFFIAAHRSLLNCRVLVDEFEKLSAIHNKWTFSQTAANEHASPPETLLLKAGDNGDQTLSASFHTGESPIDWVFKPVYSRFASRTLVGPSAQKLKAAVVGPNELWVAQRRIRGTEYSSYSVAHAGRLRAHVAYHSLYRAGRGSGILIEPVQLPAVESFVAAFVASRDFTGQIGFDFIRDESGRFWVLEGNPRATSGIHLFAAADPLLEALTGDRDGLVRPSTTDPAMVEFAMPIWGLRDALRTGRWNRLIPDVVRSRPTTFSLRDPWPTLGLLPALAELVSIALRERRTLQQASTFDIEWNGGPM